MVDYFSVEIIDPDRTRTVYFKLSIPHVIVYLIHFIALMLCNYSLFFIYGFLHDFAA